MEMQVFAVFDKKSELHNLPFFMQTMGEALRAFQDLVRDDKTVLYRHPEDFKLVHLGTYDNKTGKFGNEKMVTMAHADEFRALGPMVPIGVQADPPVREVSISAGGKGKLTDRDGKQVVP